MAEHSSTGRRAGHPLVADAIVRSEAVEGTKAIIDGGELSALSERAPRWGVMHVRVGRQVGGAGS